MSSCNNNSNVTRIVVSQPCSPCNPCVSCSRCSCDCTCNVPNYSTAGCITMLSSECVKYTGTPLPDQSIDTNDTLTEVIQALGVAISAGSSPAPLMTMAKVANIEEDDTDTKFKTVNKKITAINTKIKNGGLVSDLSVESDGILQASITDNVLSVTINMENFLDAFINSIQSNSLNSSKFSQLIDYSKNENNFVLYPYNIKGVSSTGAIVVTWDAVPNVETYSVFYNIINHPSAIKAGDTPNLGLTLINLNPDTEYEIFIISNGVNGKQSAPSPIITVKTK